MNNSKIETIDKKKRLSAFGAALVFFLIALFCSYWLITLNHKKDIEQRGLQFALAIKENLADKNINDQIQQLLEEQRQSNSELAYVLIWGKDHKFWVARLFDNQQFVKEYVKNQMDAISAKQPSPSGFRTVSALIHGPMHLLSGSIVYEKNHWIDFEIGHVYQPWQQKTTSHIAASLFSLLIGIVLFFQIQNWLDFLFFPDKTRLRKKLKQHRHAKLTASTKILSKANKTSNPSANNSNKNASNSTFSHQKIEISNKSLAKSSSKSVSPRSKIETSPFHTAESPAIEDLEKDVNGHLLEKSHFQELGTISDNQEQDLWKGKVPRLKPGKAEMIEKDLISYLLPRFRGRLKINLNEHYSLRLGRGQENIRVTRIKLPDRNHSPYSNAPVPDIDSVKECDTNIKLNAPSVLQGCNAISHDSHDNTDEIWTDKKEYLHTKNQDDARPLAEFHFLLQKFEKQIRSKSDLPGVSQDIIENLTIFFPGIDITLYIRNSSAEEISPLTAVEQGSFYNYLKNQTRQRQKTIDHHHSLYEKLANFDPWIEQNPRQSLWYPLSCHSILVGAVHFVIPNDDKQDLLFRQKFEQLAPAISLSLFHFNLYKLVITDPLTELYGKRHLNSQLLEAFNQTKPGIKNQTLSEYDKPESEQPQQEHIPACVAIYDLDHFKQINDNYGHQVGDDILRLFARIIQQICPEYNHFRFGGEEFVSILLDCDLNQAWQLCEQIRIAFNDYDYVYLEKRITLSVSVGIAARHADIIDERQWLRLADDALYQAKSQGRNRCHIANQIKSRSMFQEAKPTDSIQAGWVNSNILNRQNPKDSFNTIDDENNAHETATGNQMVSRDDLSTNLFYNPSSTPTSAPSLTPSHTCSIADSKETLNNLEMEKNIETSYASDTLIKNNDFLLQKERENHEDMQIGFFDHSVIDINKNDNSEAGIQINDDESFYQHAYPAL